MKISFLTIICLLIFGSCTKHYQSEDEENIISVTDQFASNYFNFKLKEAIPLCTPESEKWIRFMASNIFQEDIDVINNNTKSTTHETDEVNYVNDTLATVKCDAYNVFKIDTIGHPGRISEHEVYNINVVKRDGKWLIKMEGPLQSEKQNRD